LTANVNVPTNIEMLGCLWSYDAYECYRMFKGLVLKVAS